MPVFVHAHVHIIVAGCPLMSLLLRILWQVFVSQMCGRIVLTNQVRQPKQALLCFGTRVEVVLVCLLALDRSDECIPLLLRHLASDWLLRGGFALPRTSGTFEQSQLILLRLLKCDEAYERLDKLIRLQTDPTFVLQPLEQLTSDKWFASCQWVM